MTIIGQATGRQCAAQMGGVDGWPVHRGAKRLAQLALAVPAAMLRALNNRREVEMLLDAEPGMLRDLGLTRVDIASALSEPLWRDPSARLLVWSVERRSAARALAREALDRARKAEDSHRAEPPARAVERC